MSPDVPGKEITERLQEAIEQLHQDVHRVEVWAGALSGFAQPVPSYSVSEDFLLPSAAHEPSEGMPAVDFPSASPKPGQGSKNSV